jgi:predicted O-methyltransferase YrrM
MSRRTLGLDDALLAYLREVSLREPPALAELRAATDRLAEAEMRIAPEQGQLLALLLELMGARQVVEIGTFTGYSAAWMAGALPADGRLVTCDHADDHLALARRAWTAAGVAERIQVRLGPGLATLDALMDEDGAESFDAAFIDADKESYAGYYARCLALLRPGGLIAVDNTLWGGRVIDPAATDPASAAVRAFNRQLRDDERIALSLLPVGDGLTLARKR